MMRTNAVRLGSKMRKEECPELVQLEDTPGVTPPRPNGNQFRTQAEEMRDEVGKSNGVEVALGEGQAAQHPH